MKSREPILLLIWIFRSLVSILPPAGPAHIDIESLLCILIKESTTITFCCKGSGPYISPTPGQQLFVCQNGSGIYGNISTVKLPAYGNEKLLKLNVGVKELAYICYFRSYQKYPNNIVYCYHNTNMDRYYYLLMYL